MRRLIVSPHGDDETMGCGGLLAKFGSECTVVVLAFMSDVRYGEFQSAMATLGCGDHLTFGLKDGAVGDYMVELVTLLDKVFKDVRPDEVYLPFPSMHQDHVAAYEAGMRASRLSMDAEHYSPKRVLVYDNAAYDVNLYPTDLRWNVFETLTEAQADLKATALRCYASQMQSGAHPVNGVKELAHAVGVARGVPFAEQFALVRSVRP